jgi:hypothetical protein
MVIYRREDRKILLGAKDHNELRRLRRRRRRRRWRRMIRRRRPIVSYMNRFPALSACYFRFILIVSSTCACTQTVY